MKTVNISEVMLPHLCKVLERDEIPYQEIRKEDQIQLYLPETSNRGFTVILEDALCEKQRDETKSKIPVYSYRTLKNREKRNRLMSINGKKGFHILRQDIEKCQKAQLA